jgi:two-component sensor histidine kinase
MIGDVRPITLKVVGVAGNLSARQAESVGLIATELVMSALKHAFLDQNMKGRINVAYDVDGTNWKLSEPFVKENERVPLRMCRFERIRISGSPF